MRFQVEAAIVLLSALALLGQSAQAAPEPGSQASVVNVYVVPHSHDDVGWIFTIDEYFDIFVHRIYDTVVKALSENPARRFISVEMAFFSKWWDQASAEQQDAARNLIANKQLEFVVGGWTMEDEACTTWSANIDQMTTGHAFISKHFGALATPHLGWQIDPFGHSSAVHAQFAQMGFDATVLDRISDDLKKGYSVAQALEFVWHAGPNDQIFAHVMDVDGYSTHPTGLEWDAIAVPVTDSTVKAIADRWVADLLHRAGFFRGNVLLFPWGDDFQHYNATWDFENMDKLIAFINANSASYGVKLQYATLSEYFEALNSQNITYATRDSTDFFPYQDDSKSFWTGYYTSRNALKGFARTAENVGRIAEMAHVLSMKPWGARDADGDTDLLEVLRRANGEATHHDAVSGTAEEWVNHMYVDHLQNGTNTVLPLIAAAFESIVPTQGASSSYDVGVNTTLPALAPGESRSVVIFNSLGWTLSRFVAIPCENNDIQVTDDQGNAADFDVFPSPPAQGSSCTIEGSCGIPDATKEFTLHLRVSVPPVGFRTYTVSRSAGFESPVTVSEFAGTSAVVSNTNWVIGFDAQGLLANITNRHSGATMQVSQNFLQYHSVGTFPIVKKEQSGGAYIFQPRDNGTNLVQTLAAPLQILRGRFVQEIRQMFASPCDPTEHQKDTCGVSQIFRVVDTSSNSDDEGMIESSVTAGPLMGNVDFVSHYVTSLATNPGFYSDDNCFHTHHRVLNFSRSEFLPGNFYPVTCQATLLDASSSNLQFTLLTDRTRGGASLVSGDLQVMLHRRILGDDGRGPLNLDDKDHLEGLRTWLLFDASANVTAQQKRLQYLLNFPPAIAVSSAGAAPKPTLESSSALIGDLPRNVHLVSLVQLNATTGVLVRLAHIDDAVINADNPLADPVTVDLAQLFAFAKVAAATEMTLSAIQPLANVRRMQWNSSGAASASEAAPQTALGASGEAAPSSIPVLLRPGDVRTFMVTFA